MSTLRSMPKSYLKPDLYNPLFGACIFLIASFTYLTVSAQAFEIVDTSDVSIEPEHLTRLENKFLGNLSDPDSAKIRMMKYSKTKSVWLCGLVNAKNRLNAYTGYRGFMLDIKTDEFVIYEGSLNPNVVDDDLRRMVFKFSGCLPHL